MRAPLGWILAALVAAGCSSSSPPSGPSDAGPCGVCPDGQGCDLDAGQCAPGAGEGALCGADAQIGSPSLCVDGLGCGISPDGKQVCARPCSGTKDCPSGESCFALALGGVQRQYCSKSAQIGDACGPGSGLVTCVGSQGRVVACIQGMDGGRCMERCNTDVPCSTAGEACSTAFSDGNGVCGPATVPGDGCNQAALSFCSAGQVCVVETGVSGTCHTSCDATGAGCATGEACIHADPCTGTGSAFCVAPQPIDGGCAPGNDQFCGPGAVCVNFGSQVLLCKPDCSQGQACPGGDTCHAPLDGGCQSACF